MYSTVDVLRNVINVYINLFMCINAENKSGLNKHPFQFYYTEEVNNSILTPILVS